ncbi:alpha/beta fold hydrolase [Konateibacter massiliensis]|uniref:alpha/beta fold hydrolase n=1 Tax=Konateibacter massiliensis TaxID=2002841 RepID=UPI001F3B2AEA|nr:alpha/beta hydrolase [Konateibacter massiliensis]
MKIIGLVVLLIIIIGVIAAAVYCYKCTHYWQTDLKKTRKAGYTEKQVILPNGETINYAEGPDNGKALLLIHGQTGAWEDYVRVLPKLCENWHVFAVDCYGHGKSSHDEETYYLKENGNDLIWFLDHVIGEDAVVSGHSSGGILAAYVAAYGGDRVVGAVLEDPPVFSTEQNYFEKSFAYQDTYKNIHDYISGEQTECWEAYYMRHCLWGQLYMTSSMNGIANYAQRYHEKHPTEPVQYFFMPESINGIFLFVNEYDFLFGEHFYDYSWHSGIPHEKLLSDIKVPTVFLHVKALYTEDGILMAASSDEQARKAAELIGDCEFVELSGNHNIHRFKPEAFIEAVNRLN